MMSPEVGRLCHHGGGRKMMSPWRRKEDDGEKEQLIAGIKSR